VTLPIVVGGMASRLLVFGGILGLALLLEIRGEGPFSGQTLQGLYALVLSGFVLTLGYGLLAWFGRTRELPWAEICGDAFLVTGFVYWTGGASSVFGFLYVGWIVYATLRLSTLGAVVSTLGATTSFGFFVWAAVGDSPLEGAGLSSGVALEVMGRHAAAFLLVGVLAHRLGRELHRGRERLRELGELHQRIVHHMPSGLLTLDGEGRIASFNYEAERITGYREDQVLGRDLAWLFPKLIAVLDRDEEDRGPGGAEPPPRRRAFTFVNRDEESRHLGFSCAALHDNEGEAEGTVVIFQDLTRIVEMEDQLRRSERLATVGQLAAGLAHEIRNPLASLSGSIELLESEMPELASDAKRLFEIVHRETERLNRLLTEFLHFARPDPSRREVIELREFFGELTALVRTRSHCEIPVEMDIPEKLCAFGDPDRLRQAFWNLLLNAVEAEPEGGCVRARAQRAADGSEIEIAIEDHGQGIPEERMARIFDPFFTTKPNGTGLGLATVHRIVEAHSGRTLVTSRVGEGTTVRVVLPTPDS
jgi:two-component system sensor histidine kinase PilS (NtrC family)